MLLSTKKRRCAAPPECDTSTFPSSPSSLPPSSAVTLSHSPSSLEELSVDDIDKQIELLTRLKISKMKGSSKGKRKYDTSSSQASPSSSSDSSDEEEEVEKPSAGVKSRRRFLAQESVKDPRELRDQYYDRREELLELYLGKWILFGGNVAQGQVPEVLGSGPSALAAYHSALPRLGKEVQFEVICVGKEEEAICKLPVRTVHLSYGTDIFVSM